MVRKTGIVFLVFVIFISVARVNVSYAYSSVEISASNNLSVPVYKGFDFDVTLKDIPSSCQFALFEGDLKLPLQVLSQNGDTFKFSTVLSFGPSEKKDLTLKYGSDITADNSDEIIAPDFLGNVFVGVGSGNLYISTVNSDSLIKVTDSSNQVLFSGTLKSNDSKIISLKNNTVFRVESSKPIFAEISSLQPDYVSDSSDDISSVYGTYFKLFIPKEIFVSSIEATSLLIKDGNGKVVYDGNLAARGTYVNISLDSGFYTVSAEKPVLVQFGYSDDNIYTINYGAPSSMKLFSFGDIGVSSLYPDTTVTIKTVSDTNTITLNNANDFYNSPIIKSFSSGKTEYAPVYVTYSKPVIIYTNSNSGNIGSEQIPSLKGDGKTFSFRTGKVYDFDNIRHYRQVVVVAESDGTQVELNGIKFALNALGSKTFSFNDSYSSVNIASNLPVSVFEVGLGTDKECLSMLVPLHDNNTISTAVITESSNQNSTQNPANNSLGDFFKNQMSKIGVFFVNLWGTISKGDWIIKIKGFLTNFWIFLKPFIHNVSVRIIEFFYPLAQILLPYAQKLFPQITNEQLSAAIFLALILILIILIIPKGRKRKKPIPTVPIGEVKKKTLDFNVRTLEEKTQTNEEISFEEKPLTLSRKAQKEVTTIPLEGDKGLENLEAKAPKKTEVPQKEESVLKLPVLKKPQKKNLPEKGIVESKPVIGETPLNEVNIIKEVEEKSTASGEALVKESVQGSGNMKPEIVEVQETTVSFADFGQPSAEAILKAKEEGVLTEANGVSKSTAATTQEADLNRVAKEAESSFLDKLKSKLPSSGVTSNTEENALTQEMKAGQTGEGQIDKKPVQPEEKLPATKPESEVPEEPSTIDVLLNKIKVQSDKAVPSDLIPVKEETPEKTSKPTQKGKEPYETAKKIIDKSFVSDVESVSKIIDSKKYDEDDKKAILRRVYVSAQAKISLAQKLPPNFTLAVIALTPIEQRIAEDMGKRIKGKVSTGEALLIAKKIRLMDVVVSDKPSITNYQGISITNIDEIL